MKQWMSYAGRFLLIIALYGVAYGFIRSLSLASVTAFNWIPVAAIRLSCLLLVPIRYWPALAIGEAIPLGYSNYLHLDHAGLTWLWVNSIPPALEVMPIVWLIRKYVPNFCETFIRNASHLVACIAAISLISALFGWLSYSLIETLSPGDPKLSFSMITGEAFLGNYLSMMSFTPLALWAAQWLQQLLAEPRSAKRKLIHFVQSHRWPTSVAILCIDALLVLLGRHGGSTGHLWANLGILAMLLPVGSLYGWQGTAAASAAANIALVSIMPAYNDFATFYAQGFMALFMTLLFMLAAKSSAAMQLAHKEMEALQHARRSYVLNEHYRLTSANHLNDALSDTRKETIRLFHSTRHHMSTARICEHFERLSELHQRCQRIVMGLSPHEWWNFCDPQGPIVSTLHAEGIECNVVHMPRNARVLELTAEMGMTMHRLACEAVLHALRCMPSKQILLDFWVGKRANGHAVGITVESVGEPMMLDNDAYDRLLIGIGAFGLNERGMHDRARLYGGHAEVTHFSPHHTRVTVRLVDDPLDSRLAHTSAT